VKPKAARCYYETYENYGRIRVNIHRCKNKTLDPTGLCFQHRSTAPGIAPDVVVRRSEGR
jgi:hypothetical protein